MSNEKMVAKVTRMDGTTFTKVVYESDGLVPEAELLTSETELVDLLHCMIPLKELTTWNADKIDLTYTNDYHTIVTVVR